MSFRFVITVALAGIASAAAFVPWSGAVREAAAQGLRAELTLLWVGYGLAGLIWAVAGGLVTRGPVVRPYLAGPVAGMLAAALSAWLVWLPSVHVWSMSDLWAAAVQAAPPDPVSVGPIIGASTSALLHYAVFGFWGHLAIGAAFGLAGTLATRRLRTEPAVHVRTPVFWPLRIWVWSVGFVLIGVLALQQTEFEVIWTKAAGFGRFEPFELLMLNGALLGSVTAGPVGAVGVRYVRSGLRTFRRMGFVLYLGVFSVGYGLWCTVVPVLAPEAASPMPLFLAFCAAPLLGAGAGMALAWRDPRPPAPGGAALLAEIAPLLLITGPLAAGGGLGAAAWSSITGPLVWSNVLTGLSRWSNVPSTIAEVQGMQALAWLPILLLVLLEGLLVFFPGLLILRWRASRWAERLDGGDPGDLATRIDEESSIAEVEYDATLPRMSAVDPTAKTVSRETEPMDGALSPDEPDDVATERLQTVRRGSRARGGRR